MKKELEKRKKRILIDLDIITIRLWDKKGKNKAIAEKFIQRIENKEFLVITPSLLIARVLKWEYNGLKDDIEEFYLKQTDAFITSEDLEKKINSLKINDVKILNILESKGIKDEDALLVLISSIFDFDYLITFNRKHLRNKKETINEVLKKNGLKTIKIVGPEEI